MADQIDESQLTNQFQGDVPAVLALGTSLQTAELAHTPSVAKKPLAALLSALVALRTEWKKVQTVLPEDLRSIDHRIDGAWGGVFQRLDAFSFLPEAPRTRKAADVMKLLFPDGKAFLASPYPAEWAESDKRIQQVKDKHLEKELKDLVGEEFWGELLTAHKAYGDALGITHVKQALTTINVATPFKALKEAISRYARAMLVYADDEPKHAAAVRVALQPILDARAAWQAQGSKPAKPDSTPAPAAPAKA